MTTPMRLAARKVHDLKSWPQFFAAIVDGTKTFEVRYDNRDFQVGDALTLREWDPELQSYTGRGIDKRVTYILNDYGLMAGYVVMGLAALAATPAPALSCPACGGPDDHHWWPIGDDSYSCARTVANPMPAPFRMTCPTTGDECELACRVDAPCATPAPALDVERLRAVLDEYVMPLRGIYIPVEEIARAYEEADRG